jgi:Asp-tRNA(Asn)/Glu-tRNA(Gln) amidotransferase A subunit family amidase
MAEPATLSETLGRLGTGATTAERVLEGALARIDALEPAVHAHARFDPSLARRRLEEAGPGPLHGVPYGVKDVFDVAGLPTACGSAALVDAAPARDSAEIVKQLDEAGAVLVGKHVTHELTVGLDEPPTRNAWDHACYPGGSSAGGAVAVATGMALFAIGTDAAGSVRIPACANGVAGLKPTWSRLSPAGIRRCATAPSIDHVGILAPTAGDVAIVATALDPTLAPDPDGPSRWPLRGTRIGVLGAGTAAATEAVEPEVAAAVATALDTLGELGAEFAEVEVPSLPLARQAIFTLFTSELAAGAAQLVNEHPEGMHDGVRHLVELGVVLPAEHLSAAEGLRRRLRVELRDAFDSCALDALITPTMPRVAMPLAELDPASDLAGLIPYTCPFNLTGQPAVSVPCGMSDAGLPIGLQIAGRPFAESTILRIAMAYEEATAWHGQVPEVPDVVRD